MKQGLTIIVMLALACYNARADETPTLTLPSSTLESQEADVRILPPVETDNQKVSTINKVFIRSFNIEGNSVFSTKELEEIIASFTGREITAEELHEARNVLTRYYINKGYINSGAIIPDQPIKDGTITLQIIEGRVTELKLVNKGRLRDDYILKRLKTDGGIEGNAPFNVLKLRERLKILKQDPRIASIRIAIDPEPKHGEVSLKVEVLEEKPYQVEFSFNNHSSPVIGAYKADIMAQHLNLTGWGDSLTFEYGVTEGLDDFWISYAFPITRWDTTISAEVGRSESVIVSTPFDAMDIRSETTTYAGVIRHPVYRDVNQDFSMGLKLEKKQTETFLGDQRTSFSQAFDDGKLDTIFLKFFQEWLNRSINHVIFIRSEVSYGLDAPDIEEPGEDDHPMSWDIQLRYLRRLPWLKSELSFRTDFSISDTLTLPAERVSIGGASSVRGYRESLMTTDGGVISSLEWRVPVFRLPVPKISKGIDDGMFQLAFFFDYGHGWNNDRPDPEIDDISSIGAGIRWLITDKIRAEAYWGHGLRNIPDFEDDDIQDDGFHFEISAKIF